jgi:hypothetical protein
MSPASRSTATFGENEKPSPVTNAQAVDYAAGAEAPRQHHHDDPIEYLRRHRITAPWFVWLDGMDPGVDRRWWKSPVYVKFGTKVNLDHAARERYAWAKILSWMKQKNKGEVGFRMRDGFHREHLRPVKDERYISPYDGAIKELVVQCTDDIFQGKERAMWTRTRVHDLSPFALRVAGWCALNVEHPGVSQERLIMRRIVRTFLLFLPVRISMVLKALGLTKA